MSDWPTRPPRGARSAFCGIAIAALTGLALAAPALAQKDPHHPGPLPWRSSGMLPFTVDAAAFPDSAGIQLEIYVRIPPSTLANATRDSMGTSELVVETRHKGGSGRVQEGRQVVVSTLADTSTGFGKVVLVRVPTRPGNQHLKVRLVDSNSRKRGFAYMGRQVSNSDEVEGDFPTPRPQMGRDVSDLKFLWGTPGADAPLVFGRDSSAVLPNPERLYGRFATDVRALLVTRSPDTRPWRWVGRVLDAQGKAVLEHEWSSDSSRTLRAITELDISTIPAGGYDLDVKAWQEGDSAAVARRSHFSVAWQPQSWSTDPSEISDAIHLLLTGEGEEKFDDLEPGERERFLEDYWKARDPTPGTAENEALQEFIRRVEYANTTYTRPGLLKGMFTDMGRTYIRYGPADEVYHQVIPTGDETLDQVLDQIAESESRPATDVREHTPGGDMRPYEIWVYEGVVPTPLEADPRVKGYVRHRKLTFLFVDEQGLGQYTLRYSTE